MSGKLSAGPLKFPASVEYLALTADKKLLKETGEEVPEERVAEFVSAATHETMLDQLYKNLKAVEERAHKATTDFRTSLQETRDLQATVRQQAEGSSSKRDEDISEEGGQG